MNDELKKAIEALAKKVTDSITPDEALKFTRAALNMAHTAATLDNMERMPSAPNNQIQRAP